MKNNRKKGRQKTKRKTQTATKKTRGARTGDGGKENISNEPGCFVL